MKKILLIVVLLYSGLHTHNNVTPRPVKKNMTTSVIVPCVARHFFWLSGMLEAYQHQTVRPDEIVIVLSEADKVGQNEINRLLNGLYDFKIKMIQRNGTFLEGENRNVAMDNALGDIFIFSDADDIPHPQRVEIAKYFFENYDVEHIIHGLTYKRENLNQIDINAINVFKFTHLDQVWQFSSNNGPVTFGSPCFLRIVGEKIKWHAKEDVPFNRKVYQLFQNKIVLAAPLILYRNQLSSHAYKVKRLGDLEIILCGDYNDIDY